MDDWDGGEFLFLGEVCSGLRLDSVIGNQKQRSRVDSDEVCRLSDRIIRLHYNKFRVEACAGDKGI